MSNDENPVQPYGRAVLYLRISTKDQARRDGNAEGYSLPTQRRAGEAKAEALGCAIVDEYIDTDTGTRTDKRPAMKALLERIITDQDIQYVIIFKLDRWARNAREDLANDYLLEQAGAELVSCSEAIDRSNAGRMMHTILAAQNEYQSRNSGDEIRRKRLIKIQEGGTPGRAPLGYKNVGEGGKRWVETDRDTAELVAWCFHAFATGEWSISTLVSEATDRGLLSRGGPNTPRKPLGHAVMHRLLRNPYYKGIVTFNGAEYQGKHEPLVTTGVWDRVQDILDSRRNGEKRREHPHYLKGTIFCGHCESRLCITYSQGRNKKLYPYYFCVGRHQKRTTCMLRHRPVALIEEQIEEHYRLVQLTAKGLDETAAVIRDEIHKQRDSIESDRRRQQERLLQLGDERTKLLHAHYAGAIPIDLLKQEQARISQAMTAASAALETVVATAEQIDNNIKGAVHAASTCHRTYIAADLHIRRQMNQAIFSRILVTENGITAWEYNQPFALLMAAHGAAQPIQSETSTATSDEANQLIERRRRRRPRAEALVHNREGPSTLAQAFPSHVSKETHLAEEVGFEPTVSFPTHAFQACRFGRSRTPPEPPPGGRPPNRGRATTISARQRERE